VPATAPADRPKQDDVTGALQWLIPQPTRVRVPTPRPSKHTYSTSARQLNAERCAAAYLYSFDYFLSANLFRFTLRTGLLLVVLSLPEKPIGLRRYQLICNDWYLVTTDSRIFNTDRNFYLFSKLNAPLPNSSLQPIFHLMRAAGR
jgi:hypothetical protein